MVDGALQMSIIDHIYTNCSSLILPPEIVPVSMSDHQGLVARKVSRAPQEHPKTYRCRNHRNLANLVHSIFMNNTNELVAPCPTLEEAATTFAREINYHANIHTPIRTVVAKGSPKPYITMTTKDLISRKAEAFSIAKASNRVEDM